MPITVTTPLQGEAVGPGSFVRASSSLGVIPVGAHWDALLFQPNTQDLLVEALNFTDSPAAELILGVRQVQPGQREPIFRPQLAQPATGAEFELHVRLISAQSTILDQSGPIGVVWRPDPWGVAYVESLVSSTPVTGGFTETDRQTLAEVNLATFTNLPLTTVIPGIAQLALSAFPKEPPVDFLNEGEQLLLSGRGSITRASGATGVYAYGGRWEIQSSPPGLGKLDGPVVSYEQRIVQWSVVKNRLGGGLYSFITDDNHHANGELVWPVPFPVRIDFQILPGVTILWRWLLFLQMPAEVA